MGDISHGFIVIVAINKKAEQAIGSKPVCIILLFIYVLCVNSCFQVSTLFNSCLDFLQ